MHNATWEQMEININVLSILFSCAVRSHWNMTEIKLVTVSSEWGLYTTAEIQLRNFPLRAIYAVA